MAGPTTAWYDCPACGKRVLGVVGKLGPCLQCRNLPPPPPEPVPHAEVTTVVEGLHRRQKVRRAGAATAFLVATIVAGVLVVGGAWLAYLATHDDYHELDQRLTRADAAATGAPYSIHFSTQPGYAGELAGDAVIDPARRLASFVLQGEALVVDIENGLEYHPAAGTVYRDASRDLILRVLMDSDFDVVTCDDGHCTGNVGDRRFELDLDALHRFERLAIHGDDGDELVVDYALEDAATITVPTGVERAPVAMELTWTSSTCGPMATPCAPVTGVIRTMRHAVQARDLQVSLEGEKGLLEGVLGKTLVSGSRSLAWNDLDGDLLVSEGDTVVYRGPLDIRHVRVHDLWANRVIVDQDVSTPGLGPWAMLVAVAAAVVVARRRVA